MNKRQKKKEGVILPKKIKSLVRRYSTLHLNQDELGGTFDYGYDFDDRGFGNGLAPYSTLTNKTNTLIYKDCATLYEFVNRLVGTWYGQYECGSVDNCRNYWIVKEFETGVEFVAQPSPSVSYYVHQTGLDDYYNGTIYIPLRNGKFLAYDYTC
jgi:hypothetical protein